MVNVIASMDPSGLIGLNGNVPWSYPAYTQRLKQITQGSVIVAGHRTYDAHDFGSPSLALVLTSMLDNGSRISHGGVTHVGGMFDVMAIVRGYPSEQVWVVGGSRTFAKVLQRPARVDTIDLTIVPQVPDPQGRLAHFPLGALDQHFQIVNEEPSPQDSRLTHRLYRCRNRSQLSR